MKKNIFAAMLLSVSVLSFADSNEKTCSITKCSAGDKAVTYATKSDPYYACPTRELADYTSFVLGIIAVSATMAGEMPNISDKTGEPEYLDSKNGPNQTRVMMDSFRKDAKVSTFDQAISLCSKGIGKLKVIVMNSPKDGSAIWVQNEKSKKSFWMPKSNLDKQ